MTEVSDLLESVTDEKSFLVFVRGLEEDRRIAAAQESHSLQPRDDRSGWENATIEDFLESSRAWAESSGFGTMGPGAERLKNASPWKLFALFLYCGKIYE